MTHTYILFRRLAVIVLVGLLIVCNIWAQTEPVRNWAAPLYWQPSAQEAAVMKRAAVERLGTQGMAPEQVTGGSTTPVPLVFVAVTPCRIMDTRGYDSTFVSGTPYGPPAMTAGSTRTVPVAGVTGGYCSLPATAQAVSVNVTLWPAPGTQVQWITLWPAGQTQPSVSTLNDYQGTMYNSANGITMYGINNAAIVPLGTGGAFDIYVTNATNLFIDVNGYYAAIGDAYGNTNLGIGALVNNAPSSGTYGSSNTAIGSDALNANSTGYQNTAVGGQALQSNITGYANTAIGFGTLGDNLTGSDNTAIGEDALTANITGGENTGIEAWALGSNTGGTGNTATGSSAMSANITGYGNTVAGVNALAQNLSGAYNTAIGYAALIANTASDNTVIGAGALQRNLTGNYNIAVGYNAGFIHATGDNNIYIGNSGAVGEYGTIYLGQQGTQTATYVAGIYGTTTGASGALAVVVDSNGQLGTTSSSRAVKRDIEDMGDTTDTLMSLRPVTFRYKQYGPGSPLQYGLVAEEVAEVAPELVARNKDGQIETVFYDKVNAMLLNQVQTQQRLIEEQREQLQSQKQELTGRMQAEEGLIRRLESRLAELENRAK